MSVNCKAALRCKDCFYCVIYSESGARCQMMKPSKDGFPKVDIDGFCGYLTVPGTMDHPYYKPVAADYTAAAIPPPPPAQD